MKIKISFGKFICLIFSIIVGSCNAKPKLIDFSYNVFSQSGEDGIIAKIFEIIGTKTQICVEFGASNGFQDSNSRNLYTHGWQAILLECEPSYYGQLIDNTRDYNCITIPRKVSHQGPNSIESILNEYKIVDTIDLLVIDVDGNDYYIFEGLQDIRPRVIMCEYNPTIPATLDVFPPLDNVMGCSVRALQRVGEAKGYSLVAITHCNCLFVIDEEYDKFADYETSIEQIKTDRHVLYMFTDYLSRYAIAGHENFYAPWGPIKTTTAPQFHGKFTRIQ